MLNTLNLINSWSTFWRWILSSLENDGRAVKLLRSER